jgi:hypothetical protein
MGIFTKEPDPLEALDAEKLSAQERLHRVELVAISQKNQRAAAEARAKLEAAEDARNEGARRDAERRQATAEAQQRARVIWAEERTRLREKVDGPVSDEEAALALRQLAENLVRDGRKASLIAHESWQP